MINLARLLVAWAINAAALWVANALFADVRIHGWAALAEPNNLRPQRFTLSFAVELRS